MMNRGPMIKDSPSMGGYNYNRDVKMRTSLLMQSPHWVVDRVDGNSPHDFMMKFKHNSMDHVAYSVKSVFVTQVAKSLLQCVKASNKYLNSGFPFFLEEHRVKDVMHPP